MRLKSVFCSLLLTMATAGIANAGDGKWYAGGFGGATMISDSKLTADGASAEVSFDTGAVFGGFGGYDTGLLRVEGELAYRFAEMDKIEAGGESASLDSDASSFSVLANAYLNIPTKTIVTPYLGGGIGFAVVSVSEQAGGWDEDSDTVFAYQVGGGLGIKLSDRVTLDLGYRYFATTDPEFDIADAEFKSHNVTIGARVYF